MCTTMIKRGDVVLVLFPDSNLRTAKRRPALVVQADNLGTGLSQVIVCMITSNMSRAGHPSRLAILRTSVQGQQMGLRTDSVVMTDNLATIAHNEIDRVLGRLGNMQPVDAALCNTLGLPRPAIFFPAEQQQRLQTLMKRWREARDHGESLSETEQAELNSLVAAELEATAGRASAIAEGLQGPTDH